MSYSGNMPDWHQYNPPQHGRTSTTSSGQNVNSNHLFLSNINPAALDTINLSTNDRQNKHQQRNDINYQTSTLSGPNCATSTSTGVHSMAPLSGCVSHYGTSPSRNPMIDSMTSTMDHRLAPPVVPLNDTEMSHRNNSMTFNPSANHTTPSSMGGMHGGMTSQTSPVGPISPGRQAPSYGAYKGPCCNPDTTIAAYQHWEKYCHYQANTAYRDNMRSSHYPMENRRYIPTDMNIRKECIDNKELVGSGPFGIDNRRNYPEYKYHKDLSRNYPASGLLQNYPMQNYNFQDYQKCSYSVKDYLRRGNANGPTINSQNSPMIHKYSEQQSVIVQQKYNGKPLSYHNGAQQTAMSNATTATLPSPLQNSYYNAQLPPHEMPRDYSREYQETNNVANRLQTSSSTAVHSPYQKYAYQQKIAMQRYSMENHLRMMSRVPGYQTHPKYQEYMMKYRELLRLQQNVDYQGVLQETSKLPSPSNPQIAPINLQFDQNGILINSNYNPSHFSGMHNTINSISSANRTENLETSLTNIVGGGLIESQNNFVKQTEQSMNLSRNNENIRLSNKAPQERYLIQKNNETSEQYENLVNVNELNISRAMTTAINTTATTTTMTTMDNVNLKEFTDKPELDVRQFLANWDESEDEIQMAANLSITSENNSSPVAVANDTLSTNITQTEVIEKQPEEKDTTKKTAEESTIVDANIVVHDNVENIEVTDLKTIEELANSGTIVQCIQTDVDDIPTIHIVDSLPNDSVLRRIQTVYGDVTSLTLEQIADAPIEIINETPDGTETITLYEADSGVCTKDPECNDISEDVGDEAVVEANVATISDTPAKVTEAPKSPSEAVVMETGNTQEVTYDRTPTPTESVVNNSWQGIDLSIKNHQSNNDKSNLRKQHSFASEESHNPDDISLPDIPMSECTPISTTLNTPIHSDSEESSEHVTNLDISTNPIEIIPNSPIISFTHSPIKIDPYGNLENDRIMEKRPDNSLDFDFHQENNSQKKYDNDIGEKDTTENYGITRRSNDLIVDESTEIENEIQHKSPSMNTTTLMIDKSSNNESEFYPPSDPLVGMVQNSSIVSKPNLQNSPVIGVNIPNDIVQTGECSVESLGGDTVSGTSVSRIMSPDEIDTGKCPSIIDTEDFQPSHDLDKLCNMSLDDACMMSLMSEDNSHESRIQSAQLDDNAFTKVMNNILPISDLNVLESSEDEADKDDDDAWVEVRSLDGSIVTESGANQVVNSTENCGVKSPNKQEQMSFNEELKSKFENFNANEKTTNQQKIIANWTQSTKFTYNIENDSHSTKIIEEKVNEKKPKDCSSIFDVSGDSQSIDFDKYHSKKQKLNHASRHKFTKDYKQGKSCDKLNHIERYTNNQSNNRKISDDSITKVKITESSRTNSRENHIENVIDSQSTETSKNIHDEKSLKSKYDTIESINNYETCTVTKSFRQIHKDSGGKIQVANMNMGKSDDKDAEGGFEIKINVSQNEHNHENKQSQYKLNESTEVTQKCALISFHTSSRSYPKNIFSHRRLSMPDKLEPKGPKKINNETKRRHSGGYNYKSYSQLSSEANFIDDDSGIRNFNDTSRNFKLSTESESEVSNKKDSNTLKINPTESSQNDIQISNVHNNAAPNTTINHQIYSEDESAFEEVIEKSKDSKRNLSIEISETNISHSNMDNLTNIVTRSSFDMTPGPSNMVSNDPWNKPNFFGESTSTLDFDNFDVAPNEFRDIMDLPLKNDDHDIHSRAEEDVRNKRLEDIERYRNPYSTSKLPSMESIDKHWNVVPVYVTKDGRITWSPNPRYTYRTLITEARHREGYPAVNDSYYSSRTSRNHYEKRMHKRRHQSPLRETITWSENINYNTQRVRLPLSKQRFDSSEWTNSTHRSINSRYESKRCERNIDTETIQDERNKIYSDISMPTNFNSVNKSLEFEQYQYSPVMVSNMRQSENPRHIKLDSMMISRRDNDINSGRECVIENTIDDSLINLSLKQNRNISEDINYNESIKIYNGDEIESFSKNVSNMSSEIIPNEMIESSIERVSNSDHRLLPLEQNFVTKEKENETTQNDWTVPHSLNATISDDESKDVSRNSTVGMKPPASVDIEQDSQEMLTDSGLASSMCTEGGKELRRGNDRWHRVLDHRHDRIESPKSTCPTPRTPEHLKENKMDISDVETNEGEIENFTVSQIGVENEMEETCEEYGDRLENHNEERVVENEKSNYVSMKFKEPNENVDIAKLTELFLSKNHNRNIESSTLNGLDLAFPNRKILTKSPLIPVKAERITCDSLAKSQKDESKQLPVFTNQSGSNILGFLKTDMGPPRRASSDEVENRKRNNSFFELVMNSDNTAVSMSTVETTAISTISNRNIFDKNIEVEESYGITTAVNDNTECTETDRTLVPLSTNKEEYKFEKPEVPHTRFGPFNNVAQKPCDFENSEISTELDSQYSDTLSSTQFGSECADSKSNGTNTVSITEINFLSTLSQEAIDATDLNQVRKNLELCALNDKSVIKKDLLQSSSVNVSEIINDKKIICENVNSCVNSEKLIPFSGRISSESEDDSNAQDGSPIGNDDNDVINLSTKSEKGTGRILNFSGRIPSPENQLEYNLPKQLLDIKECEIQSSNVAIVNDEKNLTFTGKIQNEHCKVPCTSPTITEKIPKLIIKKTETLCRTSSISQIFPSEQVTQQSNETKASPSHRSSLHPKIPKMIIRNVRSRPATPTIEENAVELSFPKSHENEQKVFEVKIKLDDTIIKHEVQSGNVRKSIGIIECKIPKIKIKLEDRVPKMIFKNATVQMFNNDESKSSKNMEKMKIRKIKRSNSKEEKLISRIKDKSQTNLDKSKRSNSVEKSKDNSSKLLEINQQVESLAQHELKHEKIPKLKIKKPDISTNSSSPDSGRRKHTKSPSDSSQKNQKKSHSRHRSAEFKSIERQQSIDMDGNTSQSNSEKIPKVIIKRTSPSAEFKCELSKDGTAAIIQSPKWQPEVKLERFKVLDSIAMSPGSTKFPSKMLEIISKEKVRTDVFTTSRQAMSPLNRSSSTTKRRHSDSERLIKPEKSPNRSDVTKKKKINTFRTLNYDSDSEVFPRIIRRNIITRLIDDSSLEETENIKTSFNIDKLNKINEIKTQEIKVSALLDTQHENTTKEDFEFSRASSSQKIMNSSVTTESTVSELISENVDAQVKHNNTENSEEPGSVIKLESSDESQTTIEILPASPNDISQPESEIPTPLEGEQRIANGDMAQLYSEDAIPTQFELELEIVDNSSDSLDVQMPSNIDCVGDSHIISFTSPKNTNEMRTNWNYTTKFPNDTTEYSTSAIVPGPSFCHKSSEENNKETDNYQMKNICCSDSLVKEVLAAKETLKRCLAITEHESCLRSPLVTGPTITAEKEKRDDTKSTQVLIDKSELKVNTNNQHQISQETNTTLCSNSRDSSTKTECEKVVRRLSNFDKNNTITDRREKRCRVTNDVKKNDESISTCEPNSRDNILMSNSHNSIRSLKRSRTSSELNDLNNSPSKKSRPSSTSTSISSLVENTKTKVSETFSKGYESPRRSKDLKPLPCASPSTIDHFNKMTAYKIPKISKSQESRISDVVDDTKVKPMPILQPVNQSEYDANERYTSRSPPVITKQDSNEITSESLKKMTDRECEKMDTIMNPETEAVTFADIVAQMAYHEKATIKHRRYCILCERWFPTAARHRRHLTGYQHRHTELTQRRTVHALFMLFTGKPCPRLLPASIVRTDCAPGEPTPLQIAVQDVAISLETGVTDKTKNMNEENK